MAILKLCTFTEHIINHVRDILVGQRNFPFWKKSLGEVFIITILAHYRVCCQHFKFLRMENNGYWRVLHKLMWGHQLILLQNAVFVCLWHWGPHRVTLVWKKCRQCPPHPPHNQAALPSPVLPAPDLVVAENYDFVSLPDGLPSGNVRWRLAVSLRVRTGTCERLYPGYKRYFVRIAHPAV